MDFKAATRLFADPDFDGEPVVIYEPKPGEPDIPPEDLPSSNTIGDLNFPAYDTPAGEHEDGEDGGTADSALEVLQQAVVNGEELDVFDLVTHVAFNQKPLTRRERVNKVKKRDVFVKQGEQARTVLEVLLEKFAGHGIGDIEDPKVLELPPFDQIGTKTQIRRGIFGSTENYALAILELEQALYDETPKQKSA